MNKTKFLCFLVSFVLVGLFILILTTNLILYLIPVILVIAPIVLAIAIGNAFYDCIKER